MKKENKIPVTKSYRRSATKAVFAIVFFLIVYLLLVALATGLTVVAGGAGLALMGRKITFMSVIIGAGLIIMGLLILFFLIKFVFKRTKTDDSHYVQVVRAEEPELFKFLDEIVKEVDTRFPKRVYLSNEVNAAVFYDSGFWSMFLPVRKNLVIGMGLINTSSVVELRAILAHEFGHFSQRTMKVGSYVYNVNQIIYNLLYENDSYSNIAGQIAGIHGIIALFSIVSFKVIAGIQWILSKCYNIINIQYLGLSREMEFQADEVAAHVTGSRPMINALLRLNMSDYALNEVLNYYSRKIPESIQTGNIFPQHRDVLLFHAEVNNLPVENGLPLITVQYLNRYNQSRLVVKDQWASHPSMWERVAALEQLSVATRHEDTRPGTTLFRDPDALQGVLSRNLFAMVKLDKPVHFIDRQEFLQEYRQEFSKQMFSPLFNEYYDRNNPSLFTAEELATMDGNPVSGIEELFNTEMSHRVFALEGLKQDLEGLEAIATRKYKIKTFDYDGVKYKARQATGLVKQVKKEQEEVKTIVRENDRKIYIYFQTLAGKAGKQEEWESLYRDYMQVEEAYNSRVDIYLRMVQGTEFIQHTTPFEVIEQNFRTLFLVENELKAQIEEILKEPRLQSELTSEMQESFEAYLNWGDGYFRNEKYNEKGIDVLISAIRNYAAWLSSNYIATKKRLLDYMEKLYREVGVSSDKMKVGEV